MNKHTLVGLCYAPFSYCSGRALHTASVICVACPWEEVILVSVETWPIHVNEVIHNI